MKHKWAKLWLITFGLCLSINANAGFLMGYALGSMNNNNNKSSGACMVELKPDELVCDTNQNMDWCYGYGKLNKYVKEKGFNFYHRETVCYTGNTRIMIVKV